MNGRYSRVLIVDSPLGEKKVDSSGSAISGVRMDTSKAYFQIPELLQKFINENDSSAWSVITDKINYIYSNVDCALTGLNRETDFGSKVQLEIRSGKKLLFKPNLVNPSVIDHETHGEALGAAICTEWPLVAALMKWFHDRLNINYYQMTLGEASTSTFVVSAMYSKALGKTITTEAVFEGRSGDFYGGWGFYFVRKYLLECHPNTHKDNPMNGYEESIQGKFLPPGSAGNRLMVYDLNKVQDNTIKGRTVAVPDGINFKKITLHKAIVGGNPQNKSDLKDYPGCVLVNVPKLKMHAQDLITNAIKNIGIGLYPTQKYDFPHTVYPSLKGKLPHSPWVFEMDDDTRLPVKDENGEYITTKTKGLSGTQSDVIRAVQNENVFMIHITDTVNMINISHNADGRSVRVPEGYVWSSLDCVALDLFCARYCFKTLPMLYGAKLKEKNHWPTEFVHHVPVALISGSNISSGTGLDSPLFRYDLYRYAEERGIGQQKYYVTGWDSLTQMPMVSVGGHLGRIDNTQFTELMTKTLYYNPNTILHDLQLTILSYAKACDALTGTASFKEFMNTFDENRDGVIDYDEKGLGFETAALIIQADTIDILVTEAYGVLKKSFKESALGAKNSSKDWNSQGHDFLKEGTLVAKAATAYRLSQLDNVHADLFIPGMFFGRGMWPSWHTVAYVQTTDLIYGSQSPSNISLGSLYGSAFQYADKVLNAGVYTRSTNPIINDPTAFQYGDKYLAPVDQNISAPDSIYRYFEAINNGAMPLNFTFYVPVGYGSMEQFKIPNVEETEDPGKIFTVYFKEVW